MTFVLTVSRPPSISSPHLPSLFALNLLFQPGQSERSLALSQEH